MIKRDLDWICSPDVLFTKAVTALNRTHINCPTSWAITENVASSKSHSRKAGHTWVRGRPPLVLRRTTNESMIESSLFACCSKTHTLSFAARMIP